MRVLLLATILALGLTGACAPQDPDRITRGRALYQRTCSVCHGAEGLGMPGLGRSLRDSDFVRHLSEREMVEFLKVGRRRNDPANVTGVDMPPRGGNAAYTDEDLALMAAFIKDLATQPME